MGFMAPNCPEVRGGASVTMQQTKNDLLHMYPVFVPFFIPWSMVILHYFEEGFLFSNDELEPDSLLQVED